MLCCWHDSTADTVVQLVVDCVGWFAACSIICALDITFTSSYVVVVVVVDILNICLKSFFHRHMLHVVDVIIQYENVKCSHVRAIRCCCYVVSHALTVLSFSSSIFICLVCWHGQLNNSLNIFELAGKWLTWFEPGTLILNDTIATTTTTTTVMMISCANAARLQWVLY